MVENKKRKQQRKNLIIFAIYFYRFYRDVAWLYMGSCVLRGPTNVRHFDGLSASL